MEIDFKFDMVLWYDIFDIDIPKRWGFSIGDSILNIRVVIFLLCFDIGFKRRFAEK